MTMKSKTTQCRMEEFTLKWVHKDDPCQELQKITYCTDATHNHDLYGASGWEGESEMILVPVLREHAPYLPYHANTYWNAWTRPTWRENVSLILMNGSCVVTNHLKAFFTAHGAWLHLSSTHRYSCARVKAYTHADHSATPAQKGAVQKSPVQKNKSDFWPTFKKKLPDIMVIK